MYGTDPLSDTIYRGRRHLYHSDIPTKLDYKNMKKADWIKARTQELYDMLPQTTLEERNTYTDIRDEIIELNYSFFGYIAKNQYVTDPMATYEDKLQSALMNFCQMWAKYKFSPEHDDNDTEGGKKVKKYRTDLSFAVFFKPRLSECIRRELNTIKYSLRRTICMKAAKQLGKPWGQITREDLPNVKLPQQEMQILESIFTTRYDNTYEDVSASKNKSSQDDFVVPYGIEGIYTEAYDDIEDLIVHEMIEQESKLDDAYLLKMSQLYGIPYDELEKARPLGELKLKLQLEEFLDVKDAFESENGFEDCLEDD